jgi:hypothetical protein
MAVRLGDRCAIVRREQTEAAVRSRIVVAIDEHLDRAVKLFLGTLAAFVAWGRWRKALASLAYRLASRRLASGRRRRRRLICWLRNSSAGVLSCGAVLVGVCRHNSPAGLCQNCVTYPAKPCGNMVIYEDTPTHIDVASSRFQLCQSF